jgi:hypothetical protein
MRLGLVTDVPSHPNELGPAPFPYFDNTASIRSSPSVIPFDAFACPEGAGEVAILLADGFNYKVWSWHVR